jgi:hypothetical protein
VESAELQRVVFDCYSPRALASFYEGFLGVQQRLDDSPSWVVSTWTMTICRTWRSSTRRFVPPACRIRTRPTTADHSGRPPTGSRRRPCISTVRSDRVVPAPMLSRRSKLGGSGPSRGEAGVFFGG